MAVKPTFHQSVQVLVPSYGGQGQKVFGAPAQTVSGSIWKSKGKALTTSEGEVVTLDAQGFLELATAVRQGYHLLVVAPPAMSGQRYEVFQVTSGHTQRGTLNHVGVRLRETSEVF